MPESYALMAELSPELKKREVAERALSFVEDGMRVGLGTGTTARVFIDLLAERVGQGLRVRCVATSDATHRQGLSLRLDMTTLDELVELDLTVDGADEFDPMLRLIKGGGGALLREKIVAAASKSMIVIADASKQVERLGRFPLPVEVNAFGLASTWRLVERAANSLGLHGDMVNRAGPDGQPFVTDGGHLLIDCHFSAIADPQSLADALAAVPGVVEHGLFLDYATAVVTNGEDGPRVIARATPQTPP